MNSIAGFALCLLSLAPSAGASDVAVSGAGRAAPMVPAISPNFSATLQLQRGPGTLGLDALTDKIMNLPGAAELQQIGATWLGLKKPVESIPALPQSAVVIGESLKSMPVSLQNAPLLPGDATHMNPPANDASVPAMKRMERDIQEKTERLQGPLETVSKTGANAPSANELHRLGEEIWDIMGASNQGVDSAVKAGNFAGASGSQGVGAAGLTVSESLLTLPDGRGGAAHGEVRALSGNLYDTSSGSQETVVNHSRAEFLARDGAEHFQTARPSSLTGGVALIAMDVVGQSLILSENGASVRASREAATVVSGALWSVEDAGGLVSYGYRGSSSFTRMHRRKVTANTQDSADAEGRPAASSSISLADGVAAAAGTKYAGIRAARGVSVPLTPYGPGLWSWAALLPLFVLGFAVLPEYR